MTTSTKIPKVELPTNTSAVEARNEEDRISETPILADILYHALLAGELPSSLELETIIQENPELNLNDIVVLQEAFELMKPDNSELIRHVGNEMKRQKKYHYRDANDITTEEDEFEQHFHPKVLRILQKARGKEFSARPALLVAKGKLEQRILARASYLEQLEKISRKLWLVEKVLRRGLASANNIGDKVGRKIAFDKIDQDSPTRLAYLGTSDRRMLEMIESWAAISAALGEELDRVPEYISRIAGTEAAIKNKIVVKANLLRVLEENE